MFYISLFISLTHVLHPQAAAADAQVVGLVQQLGLQQRYAARRPAAPAARLAQHVQTHGECTVAVHCYL